MNENLHIRAGDGSPLVAVTVTAFRSDAEPVVDDVVDWLGERFWIEDEPDGDCVAVDRDALEDLEGVLASAEPALTDDEIETIEELLEALPVIDA